MRRKFMVASCPTSSHLRIQQNLPYKLCSQWSTYPALYSFFIQMFLIPIFQQIEGTAAVSLSLANLQELGLTDGTSMTVEASVYEPLSGKTLSGSSQTPVESTDYQITFMDINSKSYREGQKYTCYVSYS